MTITKKSLDHSNIVVVFPKGVEIKLDPQSVFNVFPLEFGKGASYVDNPGVQLQIFDFAPQKVKLIVEPNRFRMEESTQTQPADSKKALEAHRVVTTLFPKSTFDGYGFNYDVFFRFDNVIPQRQIMETFMKNLDPELVRDFGWQLTLEKQGGTKLETHFFKVASPLELALHTNHHYRSSSLPASEILQKQYEECYASLDQLISQLTF